MERKLFRASLAFFLSATPFVSGEAFNEATVVAGLSTPAYHSGNPVPDTPENRGGGGVAADLTGDGLTDLYLSRFDGPDRFFVNNGNGTFLDLFGSSGIDPAIPSNGVAAGDLDNDGDADLVINPIGDSRLYLYINDGSGFFVEEAVLRGVDLASSEPHQGFSVTLGDYDRDGWLDIHLCEWFAEPGAVDPALHASLLRNRGEAFPGFFQNVTVAAGIAMGMLPGQPTSYSSAFTDLDGDGWPDLLIAADEGQSLVYWNDGDGTFSDGTFGSGLGTEEHGAGLAVADVNHDGDLDVFVSSIFSGLQFSEDGTLNGNRLFQNQGNRLFSDATSVAGVRDAKWGWGAGFLDYDNDGDHDLVTVNGMETDPVAGELEYRYGMTRVWENNGSGVFTDLATARGIIDDADGSSVVVFDYEEDGDQDLLIINSTESPRLFRNDISNDHSFLRLNLTGVVSNRDGLGTRVVVQATQGGPTRVYEFAPTNGFLGQSEGVVHIGLGQRTGPVNRVDLYWPSGVVQALRDVPANSQIAVVEEDTGVPQAPVVVSPPMDLAVAEGETLSLSVTVEGSAPISYQWYHNGVAIPGAQDASYSVGAAKLGDGGQYWVIASNSEGSVQSATALVEVQFEGQTASVPQLWVELLLEAIVRAEDTDVEAARILFLLSVALYDAWAAYDSTGVASAYLVSLDPDIPGSADQIEEAREEAMSFAGYHVVKDHYEWKGGVPFARQGAEALMAALGYDPTDRSMSEDSPAGVGNSIAARVLLFGRYDGANETELYDSYVDYEPMNLPLDVSLVGNSMDNPNRWQPLLLEAAAQSFALPFWDLVRPFNLSKPNPSSVYLDPGGPPQLGGAGDSELKADVNEVLRYSGRLDPSDDVSINVSPGARGNNSLGANDGEGHALNPATNQSYPVRIVKRGDFGRATAEFWSRRVREQTLPGWWNRLALEISQHPQLVRRVEGKGPILSPVEWELKLLLALNAALHDSSIATWDAKLQYDAPRPVSLVRYMGAKGQSSSDAIPSYHPEGLVIEAGVVELISGATISPGQKHAHLSAFEGEIAVRAWRGWPSDPESETSGVGWIRAKEWVPYYVPEMVSPPTPGYTSDISVFSRAAAEVLTLATGSEFFPGGIYSVTLGANSYLEIEDGPTTSLRLEWATYYDMADAAGLSQVWAGVQLPTDDLAGRIVGNLVGENAWFRSRAFYNGIAGTLDWKLDFETWARPLADAFPFDSGPTDAPFDPRLSNLQRFSFGMDPLSVDYDLLPRGMFLPEMGRSAVGIYVHGPAASTGIEYILSSSTNAQDWHGLHWGTALRSLEIDRYGRVRHLLADHPEMEIDEGRLFKVFAQDD